MSKPKRGRAKGESLTRGSESHRDTDEKESAGQIESLREKVEVLRKSGRISNAAAKAMLAEIDRLALSS